VSSIVFATILAAGASLLLEYYTEQHHEGRGGAEEPCSQILSFLKYAVNEDAFHHLDLAKYGEEREKEEKEPTGSRIWYDLRYPTTHQTTLSLLYNVILNKSRHAGQVEEDYDLQHFFEHQIQSLFKVNAIEGCLDNDDSKKMLSMALHFINAIVRSVGLRRSDTLSPPSAPQLPPLRRQRVVVVGAGPVGLLAAVEAWSNYFSEKVTVLEKRTGYSRDIWFDLYPPPWYNTLTVLQDLGYFHQIGDRKLSEFPGNRTAYTVRAASLERFLAKVALTVGISIEYGSEFQHICYYNASDDTSAGDATTTTTRRNSNLKASSSSSSSSSSLPISSSFVAIATRNRRLSSDSDVKRRADAIDATEREIVGRKEEKKEELKKKERRNEDNDHIRTETGVRICKKNRGFICSDDTFLCQEFDVLVAADGAKSAVARSVNILHEPLQSFNLSFTRSTRKSMTTHHVKGLKQVSMIITFKAEEMSGKCPETRDDAQGQDPYYVGFLVEGVTAVFKRFYFGHCQMQFLFTREKGDKIIEEKRRNIGGGDGHLPWQTILEVCRVVLKKPFKNVQDMRARIAKKHNGKLEAGIFPVTVNVASDTSKILTQQQTIFQKVAGGGDDDDKAGIKDTTTFVAGAILLVGDALSTAHYRLGVGINTGFRVTRNIGIFLHRLEQALVRNRNGIFASFSSSVELYDERIRSILATVLQLQGSTMFYETYCDFIVFFDHNSPNLVDAQRLYAKEKHPGQYYEISGPKEATSLCKYHTS